MDWGSGESGADVCPLVDRAGSQDGQVYCLCTGAWPSGGQGCVQGWLWAHGSLGSRSAGVWGSVPTPVVLPEVYQLLLLFSH